MEDREEMLLEDDIHIMAHGTFWQSASAVLFKLASFVYTVIIARLVAQEEVGAFYFALGIVGMVGIFADAGLTSAIARYVPYFIGRKDPKSARAVVEIAFKAAAVLAIASSLLMFVFAGSIAAFFGNPPLARMLSLMAVFIIISQAFNMLANLLTAFKQVKEASIATNVQNISKLLLTVALIFALSADATALAYAYMGSFAIAIAYLIYEAKRHSRKLFAASEKPSSQQNFAMLQEMVPFGLVMVLVLSIWTVIGYTDRILLGYLLRGGANQQIAIYTISTSLAGLIPIFAASVIGIFYPVVSGLVGKGDMEKVRSTSATALRWILFTTVPIAAFLMAFAAPMVRIIFGAAYEPGALSLAIFSAGTFVGLVGVTQRTALAGMRMLKVELAVVGTAAVLNVLLNLLLIPPYGISGAAFASAIAVVAMTVLNQHYAKKLIGFDFPENAWKNLFCGVAVFALLWLIAPWAYAFTVSMHFGSESDSILPLLAGKTGSVAVLSLFALAGGILYLILINIMKIFEKEDSVVLSGMLQKASVPAGVRRLVIRTVFWNQKEIH